MKYPDLGSEKLLSPYHKDIPTGRLRHISVDIQSNRLKYLGIMLLKGQENVIEKSAGLGLRWLVVHSVATNRNRFDCHALPVNPSRAPPIRHPNVTILVIRGKAQKRILLPAQPETLNQFLFQNFLCFRQIQT